MTYIAEGFDDRLSSCDYCPLVAHGMFHKFLGRRGSISAYVCCKACFGRRKGVMKRHGYDEILFKEAL